MTTDPTVSSSLTVQSWLDLARKKADRVSDSVSSDLRAILADRMGVSSSWIAAHPENMVPTSTTSLLADDLQKYCSGVPLPYLLGRVSFYKHDFQVTPDVLIPRPETELLVELAFEWLCRHPGVRFGLDVGTGTGCIPVSIVDQKPGIHFFAVDLSWKSLLVAKLNIHLHTLDTDISLVQSDLAPALNLAGIQLVTANLPYIPSADLPGLQVTKHEPRLALDGGVDGGDLIRRLLSQLSGKLSRPYCILLEMEYRQTDLVRTAACKYFPEDTFRVFQDLAGLPRIAQITGEV